MEIENHQIETLGKINLEADEAKAYLDLFKFINAPADLKYLAAVLENVHAALERPLIKEASSDPILTRTIARHRASTNILIEKLLHNKHLSDFFRPAETNVKKALHGYLSLHPIYTMLFMRSDANQDFYALFHQIILILPSLIESQANSEVISKPYEKKVLSAIFREFSIESLITDWYRKTKVENIHSLSRFCMLLEDLEKEIKGSDHRYKNHFAKQTDTLIQILRLGQGVPRKRHNVGKRGTNRQVTHKATSELDGFTALTGGMLLALTLADINDDDNIIYALWEDVDELIDEEAKDSGEELHEQENNNVFVLQTSQPIESYVQAFHGKRVSSAIIKRIERQNNYLPLSLQMLSPFEIQHFLLSMDSEANNEKELFFQVILLTMFYTASPFIRARDAFNTLLNTETDDKNPLHYNPKNNHWIVQAFTPPYTSKSLHEDKQKPKKSFLLTATPLFQKKYHELMEIHGKSEKKGDTNALIELSQNEINTFIKNIGNGTLSLGRISNYMLILCSSVYGQATSTLMFNRAPPGSLARSYYTSLDIKLIQNRYDDLLRKVIKSISPNKPDIKTKQGVGWIGARYRPTMSQVKEAIALILKKLSELNTELTKPKTWITFHNLFVTYQVFSQTLLTGMRPIACPLVNRELVISSLGIFIRKEKSKEDEFNTRHIPLCQTVLDMVSAYEQHLLVIKGRLI
ncbi:MAG: hypothetical protein NWQ54_19990, partial [Paraglaciecola sp.]|nr:hypothetical protein [Paraglaciecola sp.]